MRARAAVRPAHRRDLGVRARRARRGPTTPRHSLRSPVTDENFYFVMADRFENGDTGERPRRARQRPRWSPASTRPKTGFYNGGDLKGLLERIDYIRGLGTDSIWLTPSFKNKAVQLEDGPSPATTATGSPTSRRSTRTSGTNADLRALIEAAHAPRDEGLLRHHHQPHGRRDRLRGQRAPRLRLQGRRARTGRPRARSFDDRDFAGRSTFPALSPTTSFPYTPVLEPGEENLKVPAWLNDVTLYHNRGDTTFVGEDSLYGDFFGLDDLFTEHPRVVRGMIDIYKAWIRDFGVDGFRIDTMKHVNDEFWQQFGPEVLAYARAQGKREFFMFGEVFDTTKSYTSHFTTQDRMQAVHRLPVPGRGAGLRRRRASPPTRCKAFFEDDDWYTDADSNVYQLPTFLGNHDMGRIGFFVARANAGATDAELLARDRLAHELMYFSRGNPVVYYGDEQGFTGDRRRPGRAPDAVRAADVPQYLDDDLIGTDRDARAGQLRARASALPGDRAARAR